MFEDYAELEIPIWLIDFAKSRQYVESCRRRFHGSNDFWSFYCEPNVDDEMFFHLCSSIDSSNIICELGIKNTNIKLQKSDKISAFKPIPIASLKHSELWECADLGVRDGIFTITCQVNITVSANKKTIPNIFFIEDSLPITVPISQLSIEPGLELTTKKRKLPGCKNGEWWVDYYPGGLDKYEFYYSLSNSKTITRQYHNLSISHCGITLKIAYTQFNVTKDQLKSSAQTDRITLTVETVFKVPLNELIWPPISQLVNTNHKQCLRQQDDHIDFSDGIELQLPSALFGNTDFGDFESSPHKLAQNSETVKYRIRCHPSGDRQNNKGYLSLYVDITSDAAHENRLLSGAVRVEGDPKIKKFAFVVANEYSLCIPRLISHTDIVNIDGIVKICCTARCLD
uniref:SHR-BD domain-containing protein n=1 Tax=Panagrellus redivivus TaxID=6233 RepID=A0A7E4UUF8_PANRE